MKKAGNRALIPVAALLLGLGAAIMLLGNKPDGASLFYSVGCADCHSFRGRGGSIGPDLTAVVSRRSGSWIRRQIRNPKSHNPDSRMPSFEKLSYKEISAIMAFLGSQ